MPWQNATTRLPTFDLSRNSARGINGYRASFFSLKMKRTDMKQPNTMRQITVGEFQGNIAPPKLRPRSSMSTKLSTQRMPNQSMALSPSIAPVLGLCTSRNISRRRNVVPHMGRLIQKFQRQETSSVKAPPTTGPPPPATAQTNSTRPR